MSYASEESSDAGYDKGEGGDEEIGQEGRYAPERFRRSSDYIGLDGDLGHPRMSEYDVRKEEKRIRDNERRKQDGAANRHRQAAAAGELDALFRDRSNAIQPGDLPEELRNLVGTRVEITGKSFAWGRQIPETPEERERDRYANRVVPLVALARFPFHIRRTHVFPRMQVR